EHHGGQEGDRALLVFTDDGRFEYRQAAPVVADAAPLHRAVSLIGHAPVGTDEDAMAVLAAAVGMPGEDRPRRMLSAYRRRHKNMIIEMLKNAWLEARRGKHVRVPMAPAALLDASHAP